jgi:hypothetical protein
MADRYWVGGTANWDGTAGTKWATTSGGAGGAAVPTSADDVYFNAASGTVTCTVTASASCATLNFTGFTGTFAGSSQVTISGDTTVASGMTWTHSGTLNYTLGTTKVFTSNGKSITSNITIAANSAVLSLADALSTSATITVTQGTFTTNNYNVTAASLSSSNSNTRTINLGSSTATFTTSSAINFTTSTNLTFNAGTSSIVFSASSAGLSGGGRTFNDVQFTSTASNTWTISGANTFNNLSFSGRTSVGVAALALSADQTINGTLTLSAGTNATCRTFVRSDTIGTTSTLTCNAVASLTDIDFRDITIAGSAAPVSGTRLGDCKGNSGITFDAAKTVYWATVNLASNWGDSATARWSDTSGGTPNQIYFPLAQDTAVFPALLLPASGATITINASYNIGTIDMSARTTSTMTLATSTNQPTIYGNWINGTGTTLSGTNILTFAGRGSQTITSAGRTFTQSFILNSPSGSVTLQDALTNSRDNTSAVTLTSGTFDANGYNVTLTAAASGVNLSNSNIRTIAIGSGTFTVAGTGGWNAATATNLTVTGIGTISLTSASAKTFAGGGIQTYPTLNQGGTGTLTVTGSNKFTGLTNTAIGRIQFTGGTTNEFTTTFNIDGISGNLLQLGSTNTTQAILIKPTAWLMGANSTNAGNNTGLSFTGGGDLDFLSVSYINGQISAPATNSNFFLMFA